MNRQRFRGKVFKYTGQCITISPTYKEHFEMTLWQQGTEKWAKTMKRQFIEEQIHYKCEKLFKLSRSHGNVK